MQNIKKWMYAFYLQQMHKLMPLTFVMCLHSYAFSSMNAWHKIAPFVCLATTTITLHDQAGWFKYAKFDCRMST